MTTFYVLIALQVLDLLSTVIALRNPRLSEANGPLAGLMKSIGTLPALMCVKTLAMVLIWHHREDIGGWLIALCVLYVAVIANNIRLIKKG